MTEKSDIELASAAAPFDFADIDLEREADVPTEMQVLYPRPDKTSGKGFGAPTGITFRVLGDESPTFRRNLREMIDDVARNIHEQPKEPDAVDKLSRARTAACAIVGWSDNVILDGEKLSFTRDNAVRLMWERPWVARQVENFRTNAGNFAPR
jgi:hypothetical protein